MDGSRMQNGPDRHQYEDLLRWWLLHGGADDSCNDDLGLYTIHALLDHSRSFDRPRFVPFGPPIMFPWDVFEAIVFKQNTRFFPPEFLQICAAIDWDDDDAHDAAGTLFMPDDDECIRK